MVSVKSCYGVSFAVEAQSKSGLVLDGKRVNRILSLTPAVPTRVEIEPLNNGDNVAISGSITCSG